jgi:sialidase-1
VNKGIQKAGILCAVFLLLLALSSFTQNKSTNYIFKNGTEGYKMYRIPTMIKTKRGTLLTFCEGRQSLFDHGHVDMVMKTSADEGKTWSALKVIWNDGKNTCGNPCPVIDEQSGDIVLLGTWNNRQIKLMRSSDAGAHWSIPQDITDSIKS